MTLLREWRCWGHGVSSPPRVFSPISPPPRKGCEVKPEEVPIEEDPGYQSSETPESACSSGSEAGRGEAPDTTSDDKSVLDVEEETYEAPSNPEKPHPPHAAPDNPLLAVGFHSRLCCCTNGFFQVGRGVLSEFESNCSCTTHNLVDWSTRLSWSNPDLRHQIKVREVTVLSPYRQAGFIRITPKTCSPDPASPSPAHRHRDSTKRPQASPSPRLKQECPDTVRTSEGERNFRCEEPGCGRSFCRNEELTRHLRIHSGHRPFLCQKCNRRFVRRDHLTKHQRTHLPAHVKRSYACPLPSCTHRYTRSDALTRHMWTAHHIRARQPSRPHLPLKT